MKFEERMARKYSQSVDLVDVLDKPLDEELIDDFGNKFRAMLKWREEQDGSLTLKGYEKQIFALRALWLRVSQKVALPEPAWRKLYATQIAPMRDDLFPEEMLRRRMDAEDEMFNKAEQQIEDIQPCEVVNRCRTFSEYK